MSDAMTTNEPTAGNLYELKARAEAALALLDKSPDRDRQPLLDVCFVLQGISARLEVLGDFAQEQEAVSDT